MPVPKYLTIHAELRRRVLDGEWPAGSRLPSQPMLASEFGVTVMTLRQALAELESEGLIWSSRGRGTFVADQPLAVTIGNLTSFANQVRAQGHELETRVLGVVDTARPGSEVRRALGAERAPVTEIERIRVVDGRPVVWQRTYLKRSLARRLDLDALRTSSLYDQIEAAQGYRVSRAKERLTATLLDERAAELLDQPVGAPALLSVRTSFSADNTPFLHDEAVLVAEAASVEADRGTDSLALTYRVE